MTESQGLWDLYSEAHYIYGFDRHILMDRESFDKALSSYNPWITDREPTREDGDEDNGLIECWDGDMCITTEPTLTRGRPWRKIVKPKI